MEENVLLFEENSAELFGENILEYETFDENSIKPKVFDETSSCITASSSINANSSKSIVHPSKRQRTDPIWSIIDETGEKNYCKICRTEYSKDMEITTIKSYFKSRHPKD
ncbi:zinc finger bed domain-containing protein ricesleeper 2-like [Gigaspora margarita]|uniref:Zinc finger bed domain-containing protein ricesleeper 2-like n=1 Tax=Gigaspora margarita TaxID=4874 RepID=A0A8H3WZL5_GIGMA|nr:zinc finger bed domain-containing protein ricesleeper 2-like [Gigaspora margarita]